MNRKFIMTAFGKDRPGIVADVSRLIYESGCNLEDSTMTRLADEFAIILMFSGHGEMLEAQLSKGCRKLEKEKGITAYFRPVEGVHARGEGEYSTHVLYVEGLDQAGIVYKVSGRLAEKKANIVDLKSNVDVSPESGTAAYSMEIKIQVSSETSLDELDRSLAEVGNELNIEIVRNKP